MALNYPGPYQLRIFYSTTVSSIVLQHVQSLNINVDPAPDPGDAFSTIQPVYPGAAAYTDLADMVDDYVLDMKAMYSSAGSTIERAELWRYETESFDAEFVSAYTLGIAGTSGGTTSSASQSITTIRTTNGGVFRLVFMESIIIPGVTDPGTISNSNLNNIVGKIESGELPFLGRDNGWPFARIAHYPGQNEALWKRRNRI